MSDQSRHSQRTDPRIQAAIREYLERVDRGEVVNREEFLSRHAEIADDLRSFFAAEEPFRKMAVTKISDETAGISTRSIAAQGQETVPPRPSADRSLGIIGSGLAGQFGRYQIVRALGKGAMGTVYLAQDTQLKRNVAIKTPHLEDDPTGELLQRFYREAEAAATLRHTNICPVYDVGQIDGKHFISMAYIEGRPLSDLVRGDKLQNERHIVIAVHKLARALQQAHDHGIVHRDLKPANIMIDRQGEPIIMDFGLARKRRAEGEATLTQSGVILGSPAYMSPEQIEGDPESVGPASDQYSLGVVLYEMLTRQLPFRGSVVNVLAQILTKDLTRPSELRPGLDPRIEAVCLRMMSKKASDRFPSMKAVAEELTAIVKNAVAKPIAAENSPTASQRLAAPAPSRGDAGASQIRKSIKPKALTESDVTSLEELVRKCLRRRDYDQMIQIIERIPEERRNEAFQTLLEKAREKVDEISFLICEIDEADRLEDGQTALKKAQDLLKIKPGHHRAREIQEKYSGYGEGAAVRLGPLSQFTKPWNEGGWIPWSVLAFGLAVFGVMSAVMVIYLRGTAVVVEINAPGIEVTVNETAFTVKGPGKEEIKVEPGEKQLKITYAGLETITKSFTLKRGDRKTVTVSLADAKLIAKLGNEVLMEQDIQSVPAGLGVKPPQSIAQSPPGNKKTEPPATMGSADPDRAAAEWVLSIGGAIKINESGQEHEIKPGGELPRSSFELTVVDLGGNRKVTNGGLACFKDCKDLTSLLLYGTQVTDAGLAYFKDCKGLTSLFLGGTQVTDAGLAYFMDCKNLTQLDLNNTQVSDAGLAHFKDCKNLTYLHLGGTKVSDAGLTSFKDCKNLTTLILYGTEVSDASLERLGGLRKVEYANVKKTNVTEAGVKKLAAALPRCKIEWDGGVIAPKPNVSTTNAPPAADILNSSTDPDRRAAEWALSIGGRVAIESDGNERDVDGLPPGPFKLRKVHFQNNPKVNDAGLACFMGCRNLKALGLWGPNFSDAGLANFKDCKELQELRLEGDHVTDVGLAKFKDCKDLTIFGLANMNATDQGLAYFKNCKNLESLSLRDFSARLSDAGLAQFQDCTNLRVLDLYQTTVTDACLAHLSRCVNLEELFVGWRSPGVTDASLRYIGSLRRLRRLALGGTSVTNAGLALLEGSIKLETLEIYGTRIRGTGLQHLRNLVRLKELDLRDLRLMDGDLVHLRSLKALERLRLDGTRVSGAGIANLKGMNELHDLDLSGSRMTNSGLEQLKNLPQLQKLHLRGTQVTDAGLHHLEGMTNLDELDLSDTKVTAAGVATLQKSLPACKIISTAKAP